MTQLTLFSSLPLPSKTHRRVFQQWRDAVEYTKQLGAETTGLVELWFDGKHYNVQTRQR